MASLEAGDLSRYAALFIGANWLRDFDSALPRAMVTAAAWVFRKWRA
jgi:hypothetical protein